MNIDNIITFLTIVDTNSFTKSAEYLFCSQAAISQRIKKLENNLGCKVFERNNNQFKLTPEGELFLPYARKITYTLEEAREDIFLKRTIGSQTIPIASSNTPGTYILPQILYSFHDKYTNVNIVNQVEYTKDVLKDIQAKKYNIGFVSQPSNPSYEDLKFIKIKEDPICLVVSIDHPWSKVDSIDLQAVTTERLLVSNPESSIITYIESIGNFKLDANMIRVTGHLEALKQGAIENRGYAILSEFTVQKELKYGLLKKIPLRNISLPSREIYLVQHKEHLLSLAEEMFIRFIKTEMHNL